MVLPVSNSLEVLKNMVEDFLWKYSIIFFFGSDLTRRKVSDLEAKT